MPGRSGVLLAIDVATTTGWAHAEGAGPPEYGSERMGPRGCEAEDCGIALEAWLRRKLDEIDPSHLIFEAPLIVARGGSDIPFRLIGMAYVASVVGRRRGIKVYKVETATVTKMFTGRGRWGSSKEKKEAVMRQCRQYGWNPLDDNAGDALAILSFAQSILGRGSVQRTAGPLFGAL